MGKIGQLSTSKSISEAQNVIRQWLNRLNISALSVTLNYDNSLNIALLRFDYSGKNYEFRSTKQRGVRLNMWAIAKVIESKVRNHIMGVEQFDKSMMAYLSLPAPTIMTGAYSILNIANNATNDEVKEAYIKLIKINHPDNANSEMLKKQCTVKTSEINEAYSTIKKERGL